MSSMAPSSVPPRPRSAPRRRPSLERTLLSTVKRRALFTRGMSLLVAVSGGPDSVALLHILHGLAPSWKLSLTVVHCNYGLRGEESQEDEAFVRALCGKLDVPCEVENLSQIQTKGRRSKGSLQARARDLRYEVFRKHAARTGIDRVVLGHTADDQAETVLLWMLRGAGSTGLSGMPIIRDDLFIRPLLESTKQEVMRYLADEGLHYRNDSSNARPMYLRNRLRQQVMPVLARLNPAIVRTLARQAELLAADDAYLQSQTEAALTGLVTRTANGEVILDRRQLASQPVALQRRIVRKVLSDASGIGTPPSGRSVNLVLDAILSRQSGVSLCVRHATVVREYDRIIVEAIPRSPVPSDLVSGTTRDGGPSVTLDEQLEAILDWPPTGQALRIRLAATRNVGSDVSTVPGTRVLLDADRVTPQFRLRVWQPGDWFCPAGMQGHRKKVQDYWIDAKIPRSHRGRIPVLVSPEGILWIVGHRADQRFMPTTTTTRVLILEIGPRRSPSTATPREQ